MSQRLRLRPLQDYNNQQPLLPRASVERTEGAETSSESQMDPMLSTLPDEDFRRFPQARFSKDDELDASNGPDEVTYHAELQRTNNLRKWQQEDLDDSEDNSEEAQDTPDVNARSIAEIIYAENRKKARLAHAVVDKLGPTVIIEPLYREPSDTAVYHENKRKYQEFKRRLMLHLKRKAKERQARADPASDTCNQLIEARPNEIAGKDHSADRKAKIQEWLEILEKKFPELKKRQAAVYGLAKACCQRKRRGADMQLILGVQQQDNEERRKRNCAVLPAFRANEHRPPSPVSFQNLVQDPLMDLNERCLTNEWNDQEKKIFREKFIQHPKEFGIIASYLDRKSVADCVLYYYISKKRENYKQLMR